METTIPAASRLFTQQEANDLVPTLQLSFAAIAEMRQTAEEILDDLSGGDPLQVAGILRGEVAVEPQEEGRVERLQELIGDIGRTVEDLTGMGLVIEEIDPGVVDFPTVHEGELKLLCWQFGELAVDYVHGLDEDFAEREPLPRSHPLLS